MYVGKTDHSYPIASKATEFGQATVSESSSVKYTTSSGIVALMTNE